MDLFVLVLLAGLAPTPPQNGADRLSVACQGSDSCRLLAKEDAATAAADSEGATLDLVEANAAELSPVKITVGAGVMQPADGIKKYVQLGQMVSLGFFYPHEVNNNLVSYLGLVYSSETYHKTLSIPDDQGKAPAIGVVGTDLAFMLGLEYPLKSEIFLIYEFGPALQKRSLSIQAGLNGDQNDTVSGMGVGLLAKAAVEVHLGSMARALFSRLFCNLITGSQIMSPKLKYSHTPVDINSTQYGLGLELGYAF